MTLSLTYWLTDWLSDFWFWQFRVILETCNLWDIWSEWWGDMTWPKNLPTHIPTYPPTYLPTYLSTYLREHPQGAILETCDLYDIWSEWWGDLTWPKKRPTYYLPTYLPCDTDHNTDNWEPGFMTIFATWQLIATLDDAMFWSGQVTSLLWSNVMKVTSF